MSPGDPGPAPAGRDAGAAFRPATRLSLRDTHPLDLVRALDRESGGTP